jgi:hypothetical protein
MANREKPGGTKKQAVRDYVTANPDVSPKDAAAALKQQGIDVSPNTVSTVRWELKKRKKAAAPVAAPAAVPGDQVSLSALLEAKKLIQKLGSIGQAKQAIAALAQLGQ